MKLFLFLSLSLSLLAFSSSKTRRCARIKITNFRSKPIQQITVAHKNHDEPTTVVTLDEKLQPKTSSEEFTKVCYYTGFLTTFGEWWIISYLSEDAQNFTITESHTEKTIFDFSPANAFNNLVTGVVAFTEAGSNSAYQNAVNEIYTQTNYSNGWFLFYLNRVDDSETIDLSIYGGFVEWGSSGREKNPITWTKTRVFPIYQ